jgi:hypothetical protein
VRGVNLVVQQIGDQAEQLRGGLPLQGDVILDHPYGQGHPATGDAGQPGPVRQELPGPLQPDVALDADQDMRLGDHPGDPGYPGEVPIHDPQLAAGERPGVLDEHPVQQFLLGLGFAAAGRAGHHRPPGPAERVVGARASDLRVAAARRSGGAVAAAVGLRVRHPCHCAVDRAHPQAAPDVDPGRSVMVPGPGRGQPLVFQLLRRGRADRGPPGRQHRPRRHRVLPPPRHRQQVPQQRAHHLAGISVRHQRHQQHRPDGERDAHLPPSLRLDLPGRAHPGSHPLDRLRPARRVQLHLRGPQPGMITRSAAGLHPPVPAHPRRCDHHDLAEGHQIARLDPPGALDHHPRPAVPVRTVPHRPRQRRDRHRHHHRPPISTRQPHLGDRTDGRDRVEKHDGGSTGEDRLRHRILYRGPPPISGTPRRTPPNRHTPPRPTQSRWPSLNVTDAGSLAPSPQAVHLPGIASGWASHGHGDGHCHEVKAESCGYA